MHSEFQMYSVTTYLTSVAQRMQQLESCAYTSFCICTYASDSLFTVYKETFHQDQREKRYGNRKFVYYLNTPESRIKYLSNKQ